jgi:hypothetical protein
MVRSDLRSASRDRPKERAKASILAALRVAVGRQVLLQRVLASRQQRGEKEPQLNGTSTPPGALVAQRIEQLPPK